MYSVTIITGSTNYESMFMIAVYNQSTYVLMPRWPLATYQNTNASNIQKLTCPKKIAPRLNFYMHGLVILITFTDSLVFTVNEILSSKKQTFKIDKD